MRLALALVLMLSLSACAAERVAPTLEPPAKDATLWPLPPDRPRYAYAGSLIGEQDFIARGDESAKSFGRKALEVLTGLLFGEPDYLELQRPVHGMVDAQGRLLVVDGAHGGVVVFDFKEKTVKLWERASDETDFVAPVAICDDGKGGYLVTDSELASVFHLDKDGHPLPVFSEKAIARPTGLARDPKSGNVYVTDTAGHRVVVVSSGGEILDTIGSRGNRQGLFNYPTHLTIVGGHLYVSDTLNFRIQVFDLSGEGKLTLGQLGINVGDLTRPKGVAVGGDGRIYVVESYYDHLLVFDPKGALLLAIGGSGSGAGNFYLPSGVWTDGQGRVFVADMFNGRVEVFKELTRGDGG